MMHHRVATECLQNLRAAAGTSQFARRNGGKRYSRNPREEGKSAASPQKGGSRSTNPSHIHLCLSDQGLCDTRDSEDVNYVPTETSSVDLAVGRTLDASLALQIETETLDCPPRHPPGSLHSADNASSGRHGGGDDVARPSGLALGVWTHFGDPRRKLRRRRRLRRQRSSNLPSRRPRRGGRAVHELQRRMAVDPYTLAGDLHDRWAHLYRRLKQVSERASFLSSPPPPLPPSLHVAGLTADP
ncbi:hypothetical protein THAOC_10862 [Thalassiosira oceanica]|uniref:Uncharacterized protein n=1 Tax=Thalassiosira oceanica TaxID=159749 RepID=K0T3P2_THAOC|nr:hypothetical protein THAOC_10862 [Thalassiosira oceanica]|eukprot:EJK68011.1 hypothetical protein THAOC_10862 [Thalassiosira oceanica]